MIHDPNTETGASHQSGASHPKTTRRTSLGRWRFGIATVLLVGSSANIIAPTSLNAQTRIRTAQPFAPDPTLASGGFVIAGSLNAAPASGDAHIRLIEQSPIIHSSGKFTTELELIRGANNEPLEASFTIHQALRDRSSFHKAALGNDLGKVLGASPVVVVPPVPAGSIRPVFSLALTVNVTSSAAPGPTATFSAVDPTTAPLVLPGPGTYPVRVTLRTSVAKQSTQSPGTTATPTTTLDGFTTYLTVIEDGAPNTDERLKVALLVPIHLETSTQPNGTTSDPNTARVIALTEALVRRPIPPLSIDVTPEALRTLARQAADPNPDRRSQVLDQLRSALNGREVIGGPFIEPSQELLDDPALGAERIRQRTEGERTVRENLAPPVSGVLVLENHIPSASSLKELGATTIVTSTKALGLLEQTSKDFNDRSNDVMANQSTPTQPVTIHLAKTSNPSLRTPTNDPTIKGVLIDLALAQRCTETIGDRESKDDNTLRAQQFLAELGFIRSQIPASQRPQNGVNVAIPAATTSATLDAILAGVGADDGMFHAVPLSAILALPVSKALAFQRKAATLSVLSSAQREELQTVHTKLLGYNALFGEPRAEALAAEQGLRSVLAEERTSEDRSALLTSLRSQANAMLGGLALVQSKSLTLTAREQTVKIGVLNNSDQPSNAILDLQSDNVEFIGAQIDPDQPRRSHLSIPVKLADRVQQIPVRVRTRGPGSFSFVAQLRTLAVEGAPEGVAISSRRYTVRSTAVGRLGTIISVGALSFLGIWWLRSIFRRRRLQTRESQTRHPSQVSALDVQPPEPPTNVP